MLRTKTRERLTEEQQKKAENMIKNILKFEPSTVRMIAWNATHKPNSFGMYGIQGMSREAEISLRGDIIGQYRTEHTEWDYAKKYTQDEYSEITANLRKAVKGDEVIVHEIMEKLEIFAGRYVETEINRIVYLLTSKQENYKFGGLKALGFNDDEASFLLKYANAIGETLEKVREYFPEAEEISQEEESIIKEESPDKAKEEEASVPEESNTLSQRVKYLMENQSVIEEIYKASDFLKKAEEEHDVEWLLKNRETIESLFTTISNLQ